MRRLLDKSDLCGMIDVGRGTAVMAVSDIPAPGASRPLHCDPKISHWEILAKLPTGI